MTKNANAVDIEFETGKYYYGSGFFSSNKYIIKYDVTQTHCINLTDGSYVQSSINYKHFCVLRLATKEEILFMNACIKAKTFIHKISFVDAVKALKTKKYARRRSWKSNEILSLMNNTYSLDGIRVVDEDVNCLYKISTCNHHKNILATQSFVPTFEDIIAEDWEVIDK